MRYTALALAAAMAAPTFAEVGVADFPGCASTCAVISTSSPKDTGCQITDLKCVCASELYVTQVRNCLMNPPEGETACTQQELQKTFQVSSELCKQNGFAVAAPASASSSQATSATSAASSAASKGSSTASAATTGTSDIAGAPVVLSSTEAGNSSMSGMTTMISTGTETSSAADATGTSEGSTGGAASNAKLGMSFLAIAGLAAAAL